MGKLFIKNRHDKKLAVLVEKSQNQKGLAFVMHGLGGFKEQIHIELFAQAFRGKGFTVIRFDARNSLGESEGNYNNANFTNYYEDLVDVIDWSKNQNWYQEPFCLAGHSMGSGCILYYAAHHIEEIQGIAPISTTIGG
ncbi:lysophospholipase, partial [bacterium]|nr:lysophospholipase [bacterium]